MKVGMFLRSFSTRSSRYIIHKDESDSDHDHQADDDGEAWTSVTVWRKSLVFSCRGFTVIDSNGELVYRVDNYIGAQPEELVLMDGSGHPILTLVRQKRKVLQSWLVYKGESGRANSFTEPMYSVKKQINIMGASSSSSSSSTRVLANVYSGEPNKKKLAYTIRGSYPHRSCKILEGATGNKVVAEIKRKETIMKSGEGLSFGMEVFVLALQPGFDRGVAMGLVLLLDQMFS
ncbi:unnamed protein product [Rhodiola kirilowii]